MYVKFIKERRKARKLNQKAMAGKLNVTPRKYQLMEEGSMKIDYLIKIGEILEFEVQLVPKESIIFRG